MRGMECPFSGGDAQRRVLVIQEPASGEDEPLLVTDGENQPASAGERDQLFGLVKLGGDGLLDQHMGARRQKRANDLGMCAGGRADADKIHLAQQFAPIRDRGHLHMRGDMAASLCVHIGYRVQLDLWLMQIFCRVVPAEHAGPHDGSAQGTLRGKSMNSQTG